MGNVKKKTVFAWSGTHNITVHNTRVTYDIIEARSNALYQSMRFFGVCVIEIEHANQQARIGLCQLHDHISFVT